METQHPEGMKKIQALEDRKPAGRGDEADKVKRYFIRVITYLFILYCNCQYLTRNVFYTLIFLSGLRQASIHGHPGWTRPDHGGPECSL